MTSRRFWQHKVREILDYETNVQKTDRRYQSNGIFQLYVDGEKKIEADGIVQTKVLGQRKGDRFYILL
jgi:hypothetical protein